MFKNDLKEVSMHDLYFAKENISTESSDYDCDL